jgi:hypothetical protein
LNHGLSILNDPKKRSNLGSEGEFVSTLICCSFQMGFVWFWWL